MAQISVYELIDPRTGDVFYVGKGRSGRARAHTTIARRWLRTGVAPTRDVDSNLRKLTVIRRILQDGFEPTINHVKWFDDDDSAFQFEVELIRHYGRDRLTNLNEGGEGGGECSLETRQKISAANKGRRRTPEQCSRISKGLIGRPVSAASRQKMHAAKVGKKQKPEHIAKCAAAHIGRARHPTVIRICRECGQETAHRQRPVKGGRLWIQPRCMSCQYKAHRSYLEQKLSV